MIDYFPAEQKCWIYDESASEETIPPLEEIPLHPFTMSNQYMTHQNNQIHDTPNTLLMSSAFIDIPGEQQQNPGTDMK